jgi:hypothetical protein
MLSRNTREIMDKSRCNFTHVSIMNMSEVLILSTQYLTLFSQEICKYVGFVVVTAVTVMRASFWAVTLLTSNYSKMYGQEVKATNFLFLYFVFPVEV